MAATETEERVIVDFGDRNATWRPVNDNVMGGLSRGRLRVTPEDTAVFEGEISLENNGGFSSVRGSLGRMDLSRFEGLAVRLRGDGREYQIRLRTGATLDGIAYRARLTPSADSWQVVKVPFAEFVPTFRGRRPVGAPPLDIREIRQLGFLIADEQAGPFRLEIAWVRACTHKSGATEK
jgi:monofunctional biosynthetic peptidoglycan transglycosylase